MLFQLLKPALLAGATPQRPSRVVSVSSTGHRNVQALDFDNLDFSNSEYSAVIAYSNSKLANIYLANELTRRYKEQNLHALSLHPGSIKTPLQRYIQDIPGVEAILKDPNYQAQVKSVEQGAATTVWAAVGKEWMHHGGVYLEDVGEAGLAHPEGPPYRPGYGQAAFKSEDEKRLWEVSERLCGI